MRKLERNYRSTQTILDVSGALIANNVNRRGKRLWTESGAGAKAELYKASDEGDEAAWIVRTLQRLRGHYKLGDMAVLVRTNAQTRAIEDELLSREIPYSLVGGVRFYDRAEIKDLVAYLRVLRNPRDNFSLMRIINQPPRGIGKSTLELLRDRAVQLGQPLWDVLYLDDLGNLPARSATALRKFRDLIVGLQQAAGELPLPALLDRLLEATAYTDLYKQDDPDDLARLENIREFLSAAQEFTEANSYNAGDQDLLTAFLDHVALVTDLDSLQTEKGVSLMTLHSAKGLEFRAVVVGGPGGRPAAALQLPGRAGGHRGRAPPPLRRHDPCPGAPVPHLLPPPPHRRPLPGPGGVALPGRAAGSAPGRLAEPGPLHVGAHRPAGPERLLLLRRGRPGGSPAAPSAPSRSRRPPARPVPVLSRPRLRPSAPSAPAAIVPAPEPLPAARDQARQPRPPPHARRREWCWRSRARGTKPASPSSSRSRGSGSWWRSSRTWRCCSSPPRPQPLPHTDDLPQVVGVVVRHQQGLAEDRLAVSQGIFA